MINIDTFRTIHTPMMIDFIKNTRALYKTSIDFTNAYTQIASVSLIVSMHLYCEIYGSDKSIIDKIIKLMSFYNVDKIRSEVHLTELESFYEKI